MKTLMIAAAVAALSGAWADAAAAEPVALPVKLPPKASIKLTIEKSKEKLQDGKAPESSRATSVYDVSVEAGEDAAYRVVWRSKDDGEPLIFTADESLRPLRLENWEAVRAEVDRVLEAELGGPADKQAAAGTKALFAGFTAEQAAQFFLKDGLMVSLAQNSELEPGETVDYADSLPNPLGGSNIKANAFFRLDSVDPARKRAVIVWENRLDPASAAESIRQMMPVLMARIGAAQEDTSKLVTELTAQMKLDRSDKCRFEIDMETGLAAVTECEAKTVVSVPGESVATRTERLKATQTLVR